MQKIFSLQIVKLIDLASSQCGAAEKTNSLEIVNGAEETMLLEYIKTMCTMKSSKNCDRLYQFESEELVA